MNQRFKRAAAGIALCSLLSACAASYAPVAGPGAIAPERIERDLAECRQSGADNPAAKGLAYGAGGAALGGVVGAIEGATTGALHGDAGEGALIGLAAGLVIGLVAGIVAAASEKDPTLDACMAARGYRRI